jgi:hypothetical protein
MLRSVEDVFGLPHLGYAGAAGLRAFGADIFTNPAGNPLPAPRGPTVALSLAKPPGCARTAFTAQVSATGTGTSTVVKRDAHVLRSTRERSFNVRIGVRKLKAGRHTVRATVTDRFGRRATRSRAFTRC